MLAEHNGFGKRGIIVKTATLIKQYLMKSIVFKYQTGKYNFTCKKITLN